MFLSLLLWGLQYLDYFIQLAELHKEQFSTCLLCPPYSHKWAGRKGDQGVLRRYDLLPNWWSRTRGEKWMKFLKGKPPYKLKFAKHWSPLGWEIGWPMEVLFQTSLLTYLDYQTLLLKMVYGAQKLIRGRSLPRWLRGQTISSCNAGTRASQQGGSPPTDNSAAQVPPGGDKQ